MNNPKYAACDVIREVDYPDALPAYERNSAKSLNGCRMPFSSTVLDVGKEAACMPMKVGE
jgi:hypothetical protein